MTAASEEKLGRYQFERSAVEILFEVLEAEHLHDVTRTAITELLYARMKHLQTENAELRAAIDEVALETIDRMDDEAALGTSDAN